MTRYDPFAYGQVPMQEKEQAAAAPDDMLFAAPEPTRKAASTASDWDPPAADGFQGSARSGSSEDALAFGKDILGEAVPDAAPAPAAKPAAPKPASVAMPGAAAAGPREPKSMQHAAAAKTTTAATTPRRGPVPVLMPRRATTASILAPIGCVAAGGSLASWLYWMQQNPVLAAIVGAASLVGAALAWLVLRR
jgi:hypothetical protein